MHLMIKVIRSNPNLVIFFIVLLAFILRLHDIDLESLWLDEALTMSLSVTPLENLWLKPWDPTPPFYYSLMRLVIYFGDSEVLLRLPSVVFNVLAIIIIFKAGLKLFGLNVAFVSALILAFSKYNIIMAQEARSYALLGLLISLAFYGLVQIKDSYEKKKINSFLFFFKN